MRGQGTKTEEEMMKLLQLQEVTVTTNGMKNGIEIIQKNLDMQKLEAKTDQMKEHIGNIVQDENTRHDDDEDRRYRMRRNHAPRIEQRKNEWRRNTLKQYRNDAKVAQRFGQVPTIGAYQWTNKQRRFGEYQQAGGENQASHWRQVGGQAARFKQMDEKLNELWRKDEHGTTDRFEHIGDMMKQYWNMEHDQQRKPDKYQDMNQKLKQYLKEMDEKRGENQET
uniref:Uncharacterized protein n=1 Tax=Cacopsylla melanoneura TaxID=428564 RepID=A0A8D9EAE9_9HEMI